MIFGKVGRIGHGKTMRAVVDAIALAGKRGAVLASNIAIRPPGELAIATEVLPMDGFSDALGVLLDRSRECDVCEVPDGWGGVEHGGEGCERRGLVVLVDEVDTIWDAREWADMSKLDRFRIKQSRKLGVDLIWTAQFVDQVEKSIRNITEEVELMRAYPSPSISRRERGKRPWFLRGFRFRPGAVRELMADPDSDKRLGSAWYRYRQEHEALYNTDELVRPDQSLSLRPRRSRGIGESTSGADPVSPVRAQASAATARYAPLTPGPGSAGTHRLGTGAPGSDGAPRSGVAGSGAPAGG